MKLSKYKIQKNLELKQSALLLYKQGMSLKEVAKIIGRSHEWVRKGINELSTVDKNLKKD
jgi:transposase